MILDGWGYSEKTEYNAIYQAHPEYFNYLWSHYPHTLVPASGEAVGLPKGIIGTSEIGHSIIGAGKILDTDIVRINKAIGNNTLKDNDVLIKLFLNTQNNHSALHLIGLVSPGGVHSHQEHLYAILKAAKEQGLSEIAIHVITDGRDTPPQSGAGYIEQLENFIKDLGVGHIASVSGRYYAMDRDNNWDRTEKELKVLLSTECETRHGKASDLIKQEYIKGIGDEFIPPFSIINSGHKTHLNINDSVFFFNFRPDRARQLSKKISEKVDSLSLVFGTMTEYEKGITDNIAFPPERISVTLADVVAQAGMSQTHVAETEKYAHVTYFLNGGNEHQHPKENFVLIPSRKDVPTFDLAPHMMAEQIADKAIEAINNRINLVVLNFANADMVGHTGKWEPALEAVKFESLQIEKVVKAILAKDGVAVITADHGNAEEMVDDNGHPKTSHTLNPVPAIVTIENGIIKDEGTLADIAPTVLSLLGLPIPPQMTGKCLLI